MAIPLNNKNAQVPIEFNGSTASSKRKSDQESTKKQFCLNCGNHLQKNGDGICDDPSNCIPIGIDLFPDKYCSSLFPFASQTSYGYPFQKYKAVTIHPLEMLHKCGYCFDKNTAHPRS